MIKWHCRVGKKAQINLWDYHLGFDLIRCDCGCKLIHIGFIEVVIPVKECGW